MYRCEIVDGRPVFFREDKVLEIDATEIFEIAQFNEFLGEVTVSPSRAKLGLRIQAAPPLAQVTMIAKPKTAAHWTEVEESSTWVLADGILAYVAQEDKDELQEAVEATGSSLGNISYREVPRLSASVGEDYEVDLQISDWVGTQSGNNVKEPTEHLLAADLLPFQSVSVDSLTQICSAGMGAVLADEMGLGKTIQSIAVMVNVANLGGKTLVVVPPVLLPNWQRELAKFAPSMKVGMFHRPSGEVIDPKDFSNYDVVLTAFSTLTNTKGDLQILNMEVWDLVVVDEAQFIKNPDAVRSGAVKEIMRRASLALSGTPVENSPLDIWSISEFIFPSLLGTRGEFDTKLEITEQALEKVRKTLKPLLIRRTLNDVESDLVLPDRVEEVEYLQLAPDRLALQNEILGRTGSDNSKFSSLVTLAAEAFPGDSLEQLILSSKYIRLRMILDNVFAAGEKAIVFCAYRSTLDRLKQALLQDFPEIFCDMIRGDSGSPSQRQEIVDKFGRSSAGVLLLNQEAAGYGLNIVSANNVIHFHPLWNPAKTDQATKRAHRPGQKLITKVYHLVYQGSVEEAILERSRAKRRLAEVIVQGGDPGQTTSGIKAILEGMHGDNRKT